MHGLWGRAVSGVWVLWVGVGCRRCRSLPLTAVKGGRLPTPPMRCCVACVLRASLVGSGGGAPALPVFAVGCQGRLALLLFGPSGWLGVGLPSGVYILRPGS
eukprot:8250932-Lingulodinium_polyedra.AAC.1